MVLAIQLTVHVLFAVSSSSPEMKLCYYLFLFLLLSLGNVIVFIATVTSLRKGLNFPCGLQVPQPSKSLLQSPVSI